MSEQGDFQKFLNGEIRVDGWVSDWRREQEACRKNQVFRPAPVAKPKHIRLKGQTNSSYMKKRRAEAIENGKCADCYKTDAREGRTTCQLCQDKRNVRESKRHQVKKTFTEAEKEIQRARVRKSLAKRRALMKARGMCVDCSHAPNSEGHTLCMECRAVRCKREKDRKKYLKKVA